MTAKPEVKKLVEEALAASRLKNYDLAISKFREALLLENNLQKPRLILGQILKDLGRTEEARLEFLYITKLRPSSEIASLAYYHSALSCGHVFEAIQEAKRFLAIKKSEELESLLKGLEWLLNEANGDERAVVTAFKNRKEEREKENKGTSLMNSKE